MAKVDAGQGKEPTGSSFDKDIRDVPAGPGIARRNSSSTTSSGRSLPRGHWIFQLSGNCPRCHHHHRSVKVHLRTSRLADVPCERCHTLWLGPGSKNATRLSLASRETIDPPPMHPEVRNLFQAMRSINRVATLSPSLPDIREGASVTFHGPAAARRSQSLRSNLRSRVERRLEKYLRERGLNIREARSLDQTATVDTEVPPITAVQAPTPGGSEGPDIPAQSAIAIEAQDLPDATDLDVITTMTPEQRFTHLRRQVTAFSARYRASQEALPQENISHRESFSVAEIHSFLAGIGNGLDQQLASEYFRNNSDSSLSHTSPHMTDTRTSEADTVVNDQIFDPPSLLREALHRSAYRLSVESGGQQDRGDSADRVDEQNSG